MGWLELLFPPSPRTLAQRIVDGGDPSEVLDGIGRRLRRKALAQAVRRVDLDDGLAGRPELVLALAEIDVEAALDRVHELAEAGFAEEAVRVCRTVLEHQPRHVFARRQLYGLLKRLDRFEEAARVIQEGDPSDPGLELDRVDALLVEGRRDEAIERLNRVQSACEAGMKHSYSETWQAYRNLAAEAQQMRESLLDDVVPQEERIRDAARQGRLDPNAGVNYRLLGQAGMVDSVRVAESLELLHPDQALERFRESADRGDRHALVRTGEALLRLGDLDGARATFARLRDEHAGFFPGDLGYGAVLTVDKQRCLARIQRLPEPRLDPRWEQVVPDWDELTDLERRVVAASVRPLSHALPGLCAAGAQIHLLPVDVRPVDHPLLAELDGERHHDDRAYAGIGGLASSSGIAVARIEDLLNVGEGGWVFAHELAHLAFWALPQADQAAFVELYEAARQAEWVWTAYQASNVDEFFACSFEDLLRERHVGAALPPDSAGWWARVQAAFDRLSSTPDAHDR